MNLHTGLTLTLLVGLPLMLLAIGVLAHAYLLARRPRLDPTDLALEALVTDSGEELIAELRNSVQDIKAQLARQRGTLEQLLANPTDEEASTAPTQATAPLPATAAGYAPAAGAATDLRHVVAQLVAEGLSDRTIARRLLVGVEEVRVARARAGGGA